MSEAARAEQQGHAAQQKRDYPAAVAAYRRALALSARNDPLRPERVSLLAAALAPAQHARGLRECVALAARSWPGMPASPPGADLADHRRGLRGEGQGYARRRRRCCRPRSRAWRRWPVTRRPPLSVDDRSDLYANLADQLDELKRHDEAVAAMRKRAAMLEAAAAAAPDVATAATFDAHRTETYLYLGELAKAEALLAAREKEMPADYNPPARLARVLLEEKRAPEAEAAVNRALALMPQGPRKVGILGLKARILEAQGKDPAPVLREQLALLRTLPSTQRDPETAKRIEAELKASGPRPRPSSELPATQRQLEAEQRIEAELKALGARPRER